MCLAYREVWCAQVWLSLGSVLRLWDLFLSTLVRLSLFCLFNLQPRASASCSSISFHSTSASQPHVKQLTLSCADTASMQIESPPQLSHLSHFWGVFLVSLPFRDYVVMRVSRLCTTDLSHLAFFHAHICFPSLSLSCSRCHSLVLPAASFYPVSH